MECSLRQSLDGFRTLPCMRAHAHFTLPSCLVYVPSPMSFPKLFFPEVEDERFGCERETNVRSSPVCVLSKIKRGSFTTDPNIPLLRVRWLVHRSLLLPSFHFHPSLTSASALPFWSGAGAAGSIRFNYPLSRAPTDHVSCDIKRADDDTQ